MNDITFTLLFELPGGELHFFTAELRQREDSPWPRAALVTEAILHHAPRIGVPKQDHIQLLVPGWEIDPAEVPDFGMFNAARRLTPPPEPPVKTPDPNEKPPPRTIYLDRDAASEIWLRRIVNAAKQQGVKSFTSPDFSTWQTPDDLMALWPADLAREDV